MCSILNSAGEFDESDDTTTVDKQHALTLGDIELDIPKWNERWEDEFILPSGTYHALYESIPIDDIEERKRFVEDKLSLMPKPLAGHGVGNSCQPWTCMTTVLNYAKNTTMIKRDYTILSTVPPHQNTI